MLNQLSHSIQSANPRVLCFCFFGFSQHAKHSMGIIRMFFVNIKCTNYSGLLCKCKRMKETVEQTVPLETESGGTHFNAPLCYLKKNLENLKETCGEVGWTRSFLFSLVVFYLHRVFSLESAFKNCILIQLEVIQSRLYHLLHQHIYTRSKAVNPQEVYPIVQNRQDAGNFVNMPQAIPPF